MTEVELREENTRLRAALESAPDPFTDALDVYEAGEAYRDWYEHERAQTLGIHRNQRKAA